MWYGTEAEAEDLGAREGVRQPDVDPPVEAPAEGRVELPGQVGRAHGGHIAARRRALRLVVNLLRLGEGSYEADANGRLREVHQPFASE
jgi:hypothetical protein